MASFNSTSEHVPEVEDIYEALTQLELSQNISQSENLTSTPRISFTPAHCTMTRSPFSTPSRCNDVITQRSHLNTKSSNFCNEESTDVTPKLEDKITSPLNTHRLKPISERLRSTSLSITESGDICLELFKQRRNVEILVESFTVSQDGTEITVTIEAPEVACDYLRPTYRRRKQYSLNNLPRKYYKKYEYSRRFVNLVKSKTPKIILYNQQAKCMLMENFPDPTFMAKFYNGQTFISTWRGDKLINEQQGSILSISSPRIQQQFSRQTQQIIKFAKKCHKQCLQLEGLIRSTTDDRREMEEIFPVILGRRKAPTVLNDPIPNQHSSISDILNISSSTDSCNTTVTNTSPDDNNVIRQTIIPNIGSATQLSTDELWVEFKDGCHIGIKQTDDIFNFIDKNSVCHEYNQSRNVPYFVRCKLDSIPYVIDYLRNKTERNCNVRHNH